MSNAQPTRRRRAAILREAIEATGGCKSETLGAARNYIDARHPAFSWSRDWFAEIEGAKTALRHLAEDESSISGPAEKRPDLKTVGGLSGNSRSTIGPGTLQVARDFVERIGQGSIESSLAALEFLETLDSDVLDVLAAAIGQYADLLAAVDGDAVTAGRVLAVLCRTEQPSVARLSDAGPALRAA